MNSPQKGKIKEIYFIVLYEKRTMEKPNDFIFTEDECQAENICTKTINKKTDLFIYQKVFKLNINGEKNEKKKEINLEFEIGIFYFDVELKKGNKYLTNIAKENIDQKFLNYFQKLEVYLEALKQPKEMKIYIEIPNCFNDYLSKFGILKVFSFDNIPLSKIPDLDLPKETINIFSRMLEFDTKKKIENFMKEKIGIEKYSFHQVQIFIKLFISQYSKFNCKLKFIDDNDKDVTEECIQEFANSSKYFTAGGFAKLLNDKKRYENDDYKDILTSTYDNDLKGTKFDFPLIFVIKEEKKYIPVKIPNKIQNSKLSDYLKDIKRALNLENDVEKDRGNLKSLNQF